jgi:CCR4-NOT transcription complex subunit 7/8
MHPPPPFYHAAVPMLPPPPHVAVQVQPVWACNFEQQSDNLRRFAAGARYVAVDVHYPGLVHLPGKHHNALTAEERYALVKANVDALKPLQAGIAVCDRHGSSRAWEFNLCDFRRLADPYNEDSLAYLAGRGLDVHSLAKHGVNARSLGVMLLDSGLLGPRRGLSWITYTGTYHVAYLLKIVSGAPLPQDMAGFVDSVRQFLGDQVYDVARMAAECPALPVGLERIAAHLGIHPPSGSSMLAAGTGVRALQVFRRLEYGEFGGNVGGYRGLLKGLQC